MDTLTSMTADFPGNLVYKSLGRQLSISQTSGLFFSLIEDGLVVAT
jgi:hypothetical protein